MWPPGRPAHPHRASGFRRPDCCRGPCFTGFSFAGLSFAGLRPGAAPAWRDVAFASSAAISHMRGFGPPSPPGRRSAPGSRDPASGARRMPSAGASRGPAPGRPSRAWRCSRLSRLPAASVSSPAYPAAAMRCRPAVPALPARPAPRWRARASPDALGMGRRRRAFLPQGFGRGLQARTQGCVSRQRHIDDPNPRNAARRHATLTSQAISRGADAVDDQQANQPPGPLRLCRGRPGHACRRSDASISRRARGNPGVKAATSSACVRPTKASGARSVVAQASG